MPQLCHLMKLYFDGRKRVHYAEYWRTSSMARTIYWCDFQMILALHLLFLSRSLANKLYLSKNKPFKPYVLKFTAVKVFVIFGLICTFKLRNNYSLFTFHPHCRGTRSLLLNLLSFQSLVSDSSKLPKL